MLYSTAITQPHASRWETLIFESNLTQRYIEVCTYHRSVNIKIFDELKVLDQSYEEIDIDVTKPMKLDLSVTENYTSKYLDE